MGSYTLDLITYYGLVLLVFSYATYKNTKNFWFSFIIGLLVTLVGSEYYELSVFVMAYVRGIANFPFGELHHLIITVMFIMLVRETKLEFTKKNVLLLICGPLLATPFLLLKMLLPSLQLYLARTIGFTFLWMVIINSPGIGGKKVSTKPNKIKSKRGLL